MEYPLYLAIAAGVLNGFSWALPSFFRRMPATLLTGTAFLAAGLVACVYMILVSDYPAEIHKSFWSYLALNTLLLAVAFTLATAAPRFSDLSLVRPVNALTPVLMLLSGPFLVWLGYEAAWNEPTPTGIFGIMLVCVGLYGLFLKNTEGFLNPLKMIFMEKGAFMMLVVVLLYSVTAYVDLMALRASSSAFYLATIFPRIGLVCCTFYLVERSVFPQEDTDYRLSSVTVVEWGVCVVQGSLYAAATLCHMVAIDESSEVTYVVAIKEGITAIDAAIVLVVLAVLIPKKLTEEQMREVKELPRRFLWMLVVSVGLLTLLLFGRS